MSRCRHVISLASAVMVALSSVGVAACGSGRGTAAHSAIYGGPARTTSQQSTPRTPSSEVTTAKTSLGTVLVDSQGRTLYLFKADRGRRAHARGRARAPGRRFG